MLKKTSINEWGKIVGIVVGVITAVGGTVTICQSLLENNASKKHQLEKDCREITKLASDISTKRRKNVQDIERFISLFHGKARMASPELLPIMKEFYERLKSSTDVSTDTERSEKIADSCHAILN